MCSFGGVQKLLNMNEAAFDPHNDLLPSLGQNLADYNVLTHSVLNQSQLVNMQRVTPSLPSEYNHRESANTSINEMGDEKDHALFMDDPDCYNAIQRSRVSKYKLNHPGFFCTFEEQAEVYELLVHEDIQNVLFWLTKDGSYFDNRD